MFGGKIIIIKIKKELDAQLRSRLCCTAVITGLHGKPSHKMGFRLSVSQSGHPGEGKHESLVGRNDVLTNGFIGFSLACTLARILFVTCLRSP